MRRAALWVAIVLCCVPAPAGAVAAGVDLVIVVDTSGSMTGFGKQALEAFVRDARSTDRVALVTLGEEASLVRPLGPAAGKEGARLMQAVGDLAFTSAYKDVSGGLALALAQLELDGREGARRAVVLISNGELTPSVGGEEREELLAELRDQVLYGYLISGVPVYAVAFGRADLELMQEIGSSTRGRFLVAPDALALVDVAETLAEGLMIRAVAPEPATAAAPPQVEPAPASAATDVTLLVAGGAVAALVLLIGMLLLALVLLNTVRLGSLARSQVVPERRPADEPSAFTSLRKKAGRITKLLMEARSSIEGFNVDLEDYAAESWDNEKELRNRYLGLASSLFLLIDHLEVQERRRDATVGVDWIVTRARKILSSEGIEEIAVRPGESFDGMYHRHAGDRADEMPAGAVLEVARKGYVVRSKGSAGEELILRHAEVIVSRGGEERKAG